MTEVTYPRLLKKLNERMKAKTMKLDWSLVGAGNLKSA